MLKIKTEFDRYTDKKLLINLIEDVFKIEDIEYGIINNLKYAILLINGEYYITYSKTILNQLEMYDLRNVHVVLKEFPINEFNNKKYHILYIVPVSLIWSNKKNYLIIKMKKL